ncbi:hypothetical protein [Geomonas propionica]|uniref:Uncharacterized protein n=1 Tax=Geomonas propionica TaxID=2798582 RepID=A0ABS0YXS6_9BACT|nr:hypothetical protein [Geomonas propionica]MBJ6802770.1 hypothetical protein [Geomonas propionica]
MNIDNPLEHAKGQAKGEAMELMIEYIDGSGTVSARKITDIAPVGPNSVMAYCHLRNEARTFNLINIRQAVDLRTGEILTNVWESLGLDKEPNDSPRVIAVVGPLLPAIQALKYFCLQVRRKRGFSEKERRPIVDFILRHVELPSCYGRLDIDDWLKKIWCGDYQTDRDPLYLDSLARIPKDLLLDCSQTVYQIARGSGRCAISPEVQMRIESEFR